MTENLIIENLSFELRRSLKRKTIGIMVDRGGELILNAPIDCPMEKIENIAKKKLLWVYTKLAQKELLFQPHKEKEYLSGESHFYLGRAYRLLLCEPSIANEDAEPLRLYQGRFMLMRSEQKNARNHFIKWYTTHGKFWVERRLNLFSDRLGISPSGVEIRDLGYRWGSCGKNEVLNFHWRTLTLPTKIIEYIIAHEMVHLYEPHHQQEFWRKLERIMPDFIERKNWLAINGVQFSL